MNAADSLNRYGPKGERIVILKILGGQAGKSAQIIQRMNLFRTDSSLIEPFSVKGGVMISMRNSPFQPLKLNRTQFLGGCLDWHERNAHSVASSFRFETKVQGETKKPSSVLRPPSNLEPPTTIEVGLLFQALHNTKGINFHEKYAGDPPALEKEGFHPSCDPAGHGGS
jgi:hypothetical protein